MLTPNLETISLLSAVKKQVSLISGSQAQIRYFKKLGLTYLHLMPPYKCPIPNSDGGYAVSSYREISPALGTMADLRVFAAALRKEGISLVLDFATG